MDHLSKDEVEALFRAIPRASIEDRLLFDLTYRHALRRQEASGLRLQFLSPGRIWIERKKGGVSGEYPLHPASQRLLAEHLRSLPAEAEWLFPSRFDPSRPISPSTIYARFRRYASKVGLPTERQHPHVLRHTCAVHLMDAGWDVADVQDWLGHKNIKNTMIYARISNRRREENYARLLKTNSLAKTDFET